MNRTLRILSALTAILTASAFLAGCATPDESTDDGLDTDVGPGTDIGDEGDNVAGETNATGNMTWTTGDRIMINGNPYECDDTLDTDGICDEWDYQEMDAGGNATRESFTSNADGTVTIKGHTYTCDDANTVDFPAGAPAGACVTYTLADE